MRVLAIDTALAACSAAVLDTEHGGIIAERKPADDARSRRSADAAARPRRWSDAGMTLPEIDRVVVTTGPGSFTGLRVGIAAARGIALAAEKPAVGVSTLSAYAAPHMAADEHGAGRSRHRRAARARLSAGFQPRRPHARRRRGSRRLREAVQAARRRPPASSARRRKPSPPLMARSSAARRAVIDARAAPDIAWVARMGAICRKDQSPPKPQYLRAPDAQPQNAAQLPRR